MGKTWHPDRWDTALRFRREGHDTDWRKQYEKEQEEVTNETGVFIIVNEWTDIAGATSSEVVGGKYFLTENDAWIALHLIAASYGVDLDGDETTLQLEEHTPNLQNEEYVIEELTRG